ncbi:MAG: polyprenyl synthetase family protein [Lachnospiraceae bacterium]
MGIEEEVRDRAKEIDSIVTTFLPQESGWQKTIFEAMNYSVLAGGKRIRPMLMQETFLMFQGEGDMLYPFMAAIECIHTYSLVHDDLPAMDNDEFRRGKKTTHAVYGEAMGILAGDALLNYAYELIASEMAKTPGNPTLAHAFFILSQKAGIFGMVGGQTIDIESVGTDESSLKRLIRIHELKTSALIEAAMMCGAILAGADEKQVKKIETCARKVGLAFQIQDDILDVTSCSEILGKPVGSDERNHKTTMVSLLGLEKAKVEVKSLTDSALVDLHSLPVSSSFLENFLLYLIYRKN